MHAVWQVKKSTVGKIVRNYPQRSWPNVASGKAGQFQPAWHCSCKTGTICHWITFGAGFSHFGVEASFWPAAPCFDNL
jgi:hypothetical protein